MITSSVITALTGKFGSGKTALATLAALDASNGQLPIWANYGLMGSIRIRAIEDLYQCEGGVIVLDEAHSTAHARTALANGEFLEWFDQCRKQDCEIFICTQALSKLDRIIREMFNMEFACRDIGNLFTEVTVWDLDPERRRMKFIYDRRPMFPYYDHRERVPALLEKPKEVRQREKQMAATTLRSAR